MKKVLFVIALCVSVALANAQTQTAPKTPAKPAPAVKTATMPGKTVVKEAELLKPITENIAKDYAGAKIVKAFKNDAKGVVTYEVHVSTKDNAKLTLVYDKDGKFIKKEEMKTPTTAPAKVAPAPKK